MYSMKKLKAILLVFVCICGFMFAACDFSPNTETMSISGYAYFESVPMKDVLIKSNTKTLTTTNDFGNFSFEKTKTITTIYAEKTGYIFTPKSIEVSETTDNIVFVATKIEDLNGTLSLSKINITPTSIVSITDNYLFNLGGKSCLKIKNINVSIGNSKYNCINQDLYAEKNKNNFINVEHDLFANTGENFAIEFSIDAYFSSYRNEYIYLEEKASILNVTKQQTTAHLTENNQIEYTFVGVNATNNKFSYNITFIFDYYPNV